MKRDNPEERLHFQVADMLEGLSWWYWHTPLGELRPKKTVTRGGRTTTFSPVGKKLARMGAKRGVADIIVGEPWTCRSYELSPCVLCPDELHYEGFPGYARGSMLAIELKAGRNRMTPSQSEWLKNARAHGWLTAVCRSVNEVAAVLSLVRPLNGRRLT
jgi:hypothetical protein